jgi:hypothetical protein
MRAAPKAFFVVLGVLLLGACGGDSSTGVNADATGTYTLRSINGNLIPYSFPVDATTSVTFTGGNFTINTGSDFSETISYDFTTSGQTTSTTSVCPGTYTQIGTRFTFTEAASNNPDCGAAYTGSWDGSATFTIAFQLGVQAIYAK